MYMKVTSVPELPRYEWIKPTEDLAAKGIPVTLGGQGTFCFDGLWKTNIEKNSVFGIFTVPNTGISYNMYCAGALQKAAMAVTATAAMVAASAY